MTQQPPLRLDVGDLPVAQAVKDQGLALGPERARVPEGPGLGVELDEEQLEKYRDRSGKARGLGRSTETTFEG